MGMATAMATTKLFSKAKARVCSLEHKNVTIKSQTKLKENATIACFILLFWGLVLMKDVECSSELYSSQAAG